MSMVIKHNMSALNAERQFNTVTKAKNKRAEKLSSGYRINRAADDAAGLSISEKMRRQIRGFRVGTENAQTGISWVQIGEGALNEAHDILHRMNELSIKSQNGTNTLTDRAYMQAEFEHLQSELDRISSTTTFNEINIFEEHEPVYDQISGNIKWDYEEYHEVRAGKNDLTIVYRTDGSEEAQVMTISVAAGRYTTHELIDAIDDAFGLDSPIHMEFTEKGLCKLNLENGEVMDAVTGGLTYLLWDNYDGGGYGTLIGTTEFIEPDDTLEIVQGQNDSMKFTFEYFDPEQGEVPPIEINLFDIAKAKGHQVVNTPEGPAVRLTKAEIMDYIDGAVPSETGLKTDHHGYAIMLYSSDGIVTGFKGNMFKIENEEPYYTSAFYDNIQYGYVWQDPASVVGGAVLTTDVRDEEHNRYYIDNTNNKLVLQPNLTTAPVTVEITVKPKNAADPTQEGYTAQEMVDELNKQFAAKGIDGEVQAYLVRSNSKVRDPYPDGKNPGGAAATAESVGDDSLVFEGIEIRTVKEGPDAIVNIDKDQSTAYDTLFTIKNYNMYGTGTSWDAVVDNETIADYNGYSLGQSAITGSINFTSANNKFELTLRSTANRNSQFDGYPYATSYDYDQTFTIDVGTGSKDLDAIISAINTDFGKHDVVVGKDDAGNDIKVKLSSRIEAVKDGNYIKIVDKEDLTLDNADHKYPNWYTQIDLNSSGGNAGYRILFQRKEDYEENKTYTYKGSAELTAKGPNGTLTGPVTFYINGVPHTIGSYGDTPTIAKKDYEFETPIIFSPAESKCETKPQNFDVEGNGTTTYTYYPGGSAQGQSEKYQGRTGYKMNTPATLEVGPAITFPVTVDDNNNKITLGLNGKDYTFTLANSAGSAFDTDNNGRYSQSELVNALQAAIDDQAGTGFGGAVVEIKNDQLVITSRLNAKNDDGSRTSITAYAQGQKVNTFFDSIGKSETAASCTSKMKLQSSVTVTAGDNSDIFSFSFRDKNGASQFVSFSLLNDGETTKTFDTTALLIRINEKLKENGTTWEGKVEAKNVGGYLVLSTTDKGEKTHIEYTTGPAGSATKNALALFGDIDTGVTTPAAQITLNQNVRATPYTSFTGTKTFIVEIDGQARTFYVQNWTSTDSGANSLVSQLNNGVGGNAGLSAYGVTASISGGKLVLKKDAAVAGTSLKMSYGSGGTAMEYIFGKTQAPRADDVEIIANGSQLTIRALGADGKYDPNAVINIDSDDSGGTLAGKPAVRYWDHVRQQGFHSAKFSTVTSVDLSDFVKDGGIELTRWNNELEFEFTKNGTAKTEADKNWTKVSFRLTESAPGTKTSIEDIVKELQSKMDAALGKDVIEVLFDTNTNKLSIKAAKPGAQFQFKGMRSTASGGNTALDETNKIGGGFYHHVMCRREEQKNTLQDPTDINGDQFPGDIFAQGRHDLILDPAGLHPGISDTLILDLNYFEDADHDGVLDADKDRNGKLDAKEMKDVKTITLTLHLDELTEPIFEIDTPSEKVIEIMRKKIKEAINSEETQNQAKALGVVLHDNLIEVDMGRHDTGIWGNKDKVSMSFTITKNEDISTPVEGYFYIDGIRGNAAYETFYYTEGELIPGFIEGTKDISKGVVLGDNDNELCFLVDGELKSVDLSGLEKNKLISASEIIHTITDQFKEQNLPLAVSIGTKGNLRISFDRMGKHVIDQVTGSARNELFFEEHSAKRLNRERQIRVSSNEGDWIEVYSPRFSTTMLNINSICISTIKNAEKATNRLKEALKMVSDMRSTFGAIQNRIEHTINNNRNKEENTTAAESRIRDADISTEMVDFSNLSIIQQAGQAVLAQANQSRNLLLSLLG